MVRTLPLLLWAATAMAAPGGTHLPPGKHKLPLGKKAYEDAFAKMARQEVTKMNEEPTVDDNDKIFAYDWDSYKLDNGLNVIIMPLQEDFPGLVSVHLTVNAGSRNELEPGKTGMAHFFEHMMFRGTPTISSEEFDRTYTELGGYNNAWTWMDQTNYYVTIPKTSANGTSNLETVLYMESDRFKNSNYSLADFQTEAGAILGEYNRFSNEIWHNLDLARINLSFPVHPYGHTTIGTMEDIRDMPNELEYSRTFFDRFYKPEHCTLMIFGDVDDMDAAKDLVEQYWGPWESGDNYVSDIPQETLPRDAAIYHHVEWPEAASPWISLSFNAANFTVYAPDTAALDIIQFMIFSGASALTEQLVYDEQVAMDLSASYAWTIDPHLFVIEANVADVRDIWYVRDTILKSIAKLRVEPVSATDLNKVKSNLKFMKAMTFVSTDAIADEIQYLVSLTNDPNSINLLYEWYDSITPETIMEIANKYFTDDRLVTITLAHKDESMPPVEAVTTGDAFAGSVDAFVEELTMEDTFVVDQVLLPSESSKLVDFDIRFRVGSDDDPSDMPGLASMTIHMMAYAGSAEHAYDEIKDLFFPMNGWFSGATGKDYSFFSGMAHVENLNQYYEIVSGMLLKPGFRQDDFDRIKLEKIRAIEDAIYDDGTVAARAFDAELYAGTASAHSNAGTIDSLNRMTLGDVKAFYASRFTKQSVLLGLAGGFSDTFVQKMNADFRKLPDGPVDKELLPVPENKAGSNAVIIEQQGTDATSVMFGFTLPSDTPLNRGHPDYAALNLALWYFGGGFTSQLMQQIRQKRGINYHNSARLRFGGEALQISIGAVDNIETAHFTTRLAMYELNKLLVNGMTQEAFEFERKAWYNSLPVSVSTPAVVLDLATQGFEMGYGDDYLTYMQGQLNAVTVDDVNAAIAKWLQDTNVTFVFVTPDAEDLKSRLVSETTSNITYATADQPEDVSAEDAIIKEYPLGFEESSVNIVSPEELFGIPLDEPNLEPPTGDVEPIIETFSEATTTALDRSAEAPIEKKSDEEELQSSQLMQTMKGDDIQSTDLDVAADTMVSSSGFFIRRSVALLSTIVAIAFVW